MRSYVNSVPRDSATYTNFMVFGKGMSFRERGQAEDTLVTMFNNAGVNAIRALDYFPTSKAYTDEEMTSGIIRSGVEAVLTLELTGQDVSQEYVPPEYTPGKTVYTVETVDNKTYVTEETEPGRMSGDYYINRPLASYHLSLMDVKTGNHVWFADADSTGGSMNDFQDLARSAARTAVEQLHEDGLIDVSPSATRMKKGQTSSSDTVGRP